MPEVRDRHLSSVRAVAFVLVLRLSPERLWHKNKKISSFEAETENAGCGDEVSRDYLLPLSDPVTFSHSTSATLTSFRRWRIGVDPRQG